MELLGLEIVQSIVDAEFQPLDTFHRQLTEGQQSLGTLGPQE